LICIIYSNKIEFKNSERERERERVREVRKNKSHFKRVN